MTSGEKVLQLLDNEFHPKKIGRLWHFSCPCCHQPLGRSMHFNPEMNVLRCFQSACDFGGKWSHASVLLEYLWGDRYKDILKDTSDIVKYKAPDKAPNYKITLPEHFIPIKEGKGVLSDRARDYLKKRNFDLDYLETLGVGYVKQSGTKFSMRIIIPFFDRFGTIVFFQGRDFSGYQQRWDQPSLDQVGIGKSMLLYNERVLWHNPLCYVFEGCTDAWELKVAVATSGKSLSTTQSGIITRSPVQQVVLGYDSGAYIDALHAAYPLILAGKQVKVLSFDTGDANSLGRAFVERQEQQTPFLTLEEYYKQIASIKKDKEKTFRGDSTQIKLW